MRTSRKAWLITAAFLVLAGCAVFGGAMSMLKWDFTKLSTHQYETIKHEINEDFSGISITAETADITLVPSEDAKCSVVCYEQKKVTHKTAVKDNMLVIEAVDARKWYEYIGINIGTPKITVYLPKEEYSRLIIKDSTGDVEIPNGFHFEDVEISLNTGVVDFFASASKRNSIKTNTGRIGVKNTDVGELALLTSTGRITVSNVICEGDCNIRVSTGKSDLTNVRCNNLTSDGNTGDIFLNNVIAAEEFWIKRSTGDVKFDSCDAAEITVETDTGDVSGSLLTDKIFVTQTDTGRVDVPERMTGGRCKIETDTGNIKITVK